MRTSWSPPLDLVGRRPHPTGGRDGRTGTRPWSPGRVDPARPVPERGRHRRSTCRPGRRAAASTRATSRHRRHRLRRRAAGPAAPGRGRRRALPGARPREAARRPVGPRRRGGARRPARRGRRAARLRRGRCRVLPRALPGRPRLRGDRPPRRDDRRPAARDCGVRRIVYLGGLHPDGPLSAHLESRREVGEILLCQRRAHGRAAGRRRDRVRVGESSRCCAT